MKITQADQRRVSLMERLLEQQAYAELQTFVSEEFANDLLGEGLLNAARALRSNKTVIFLATLGVANLPHPDGHAMWLVCYQSMAQGQESEGFQTLPDYLPTKWVVRKCLQSIDLPLPSAGAAAADWLDAIELAIDLVRLDLLEPLLQHLSSQTQPQTTWLAVAKTLVDREPLLHNQPDLVFYARSLALLLPQLHDDADSTHLRSAIAAIAARCFLEVDQPLLAKAMALAIKDTSVPYQYEHAVRMAEACCRANEHLDAIAWMDRALTLSMHPELLEEWRQNVKKKKQRAAIAPVFDPDQAAQALATLQDVLSPHGHKMFLVSGTLLGYAREGRLLGHDKDIDVGIMGWINQFDVTNAILQSRKFYVETFTLGKDDAYIVPVQHIETQTAIDVFIYRPEGEKLVTGVNNQFGYLQKFAFTPFEPQPIHFLGVQLYAPSDIELNLRENYGDGWRISDPDYLSHLESPSTTDVGGLVHQIVGRLSIYSALINGKTAKLLRALAVMERVRQRPGGIGDALSGQLRDLAGRLDAIMHTEDESTPAL